MMLIVMMMLLLVDFFMVGHNGGAETLVNVQRWRCFFFTQTTQSRLPMNANSAPINLIVHLDWGCTHRIANTDR